MGKIALGALEPIFTPTFTIAALIDVSERDAIRRTRRSKPEAIADGGDDLARVIVMGPGE